MKQRLLEALRAKFEGVSAQILNRQAERLAKTVTKEEDVETAVEGVTLQQLIEAESDRRATDASLSAVANYEKKYSLKDGKLANGGAQSNNEPNTPQNQSENTAQAGDLSGQIAAAVKAAVEPLMSKITSLEAGKIADTRKQRLDAAIANASETFKEKASRYYDRVTFKDDEDYESWLQEITEDAKTHAVEAAAQGAVFGRPFVGGTPQKDIVSNGVKDYIAAKNGKQEGQPF